MWLPFPWTVYYLALSASSSGRRRRSGTTTTTSPKEACLSRRQVAVRTAASLVGAGLGGGSFPQTSAAALEENHNSNNSNSDFLSFINDKTTFRIETLPGLRTLPCNSQSSSLQSQRDDVLEIEYEASFVVDRNNNNNNNSPTSNPTTVLYDSSAQRGTGQPYQLVLGNGNMGLPAVDLGLYDMCIGQKRRLILPPQIAYGHKGNRLYGIPPDATLVWEVTLIRLNGQGVDSTMTRDEMNDNLGVAVPW